MAESVDSLVLEQLRLIRADQAAMKDDLREVRNRLATLELGQGTILQHMGHLASSIAQQQLAFDRFGERVERIERRLSLADAS